MKFAKDKEGGFLLLESLITLGVVAAIILTLFPLLVNWLAIRDEAKKEVELNRIVYEQSMDWNNQSAGTQADGAYKIQKEKNKLQVKNGQQSVEVVINAYAFE